MSCEFSPPAGTAIGSGIWDIAVVESFWGGMLSHSSCNNNVKHQHTRGLAITSVHLVVDLRILQRHQLSARRGRIRHHAAVVEQPDVDRPGMGDCGPPVVHMSQQGGVVEGCMESVAMTSIRGHSGQRYHCGETWVRVVHAQNVAHLVHNVPASNSMTVQTNWQIEHVRGEDILANRYTAAKPSSENAPTEHSP
jgi:hypothetical protein